jgi:hypothetical protein
MQDGMQSVQNHGADLAQELAGLREQQVDSS